MAQGHTQPWVLQRQEEKRNIGEAYLSLSPAIFVFINVLVFSGGKTLHSH